MPGYRAIRRSAAVLAAVGLVSGFVAGCTAEQSVPTIAFPSVSAGAQLVGQLPVSAAPSYTGYAPPLNAITVKLSGIAAGAKLSYPMAWLNFSVTYTNISTFAFQSLDPLIVFGQCTCTPAHYNIAPGTALQVLDTGTAAWKNITPSDLDSGNSFTYSAQLGSINLGPKAAVTYKYRMELGRTVARTTGLVNGTGTLNVYVLQLPGHTRLSAGVDPEASLPLNYVFH